MSRGALRGRLATAAGPLPRRGADLGTLTVLEDAVISWTDGLIDHVGPADDHPEIEPETVDGLIVPGFVDCHTHLPFIGWRADEYEARREGRTYQELHGGGGIYRSARLFEAADDDEVTEFCLPLLREALSHGTTALELKTGYGLSVEAELRQARIARLLSELVPQTCTVTLLACHAVPPDVKRADWVSAACTELIPEAARSGLVDTVDIYVEDIAFTVQDLHAVAQATATAGLRLRCHVEQLSNLSGAVAAAELGAMSVDHLNHLDAAAVERLGESDAICVLLPASTFILGSAPPPARALIDAGAALAVASDFNPGTSPVLSVPEVIAFAAGLYDLSAAEALTAATANAACVLGLEERLGTLEVGKRADLLVLDGRVEHLPYRPGHNPVVRKFTAGAEQH